MNFRPLNAEEIEVRVGTCSEKGVSLLLYKDARCDARILDETVGAESWQCRFYENKGTLFCSVALRILFPDGFEWVSKDDAGSPSNMEAAKGEASDAFKRACFKWGIGRELYTAPFIWVPAEKCNIKAGKSGKPSCYDNFSVAKIAIENGAITGVRVMNDTTKKVAFSWARG